MKLIVSLLIALISFSTLASSELELIKLNEATFSEKQLKTQPELCDFHRELQIKAKVAPIECPRNEGSKTRDDEVAKQLREVNELAQIPNHSSLDRMIINIPTRSR